MKVEKHYQKKFKGDEFHGVNVTLEGGHLAVERIYKLLEELDWDNKQ